MIRRGDWMQTYTGRQFWPLDPRPEDVCIEDIAHALSLICRFGGHVREFYSVAQHSMLVSHLVPADDALAGALHDAREAYVGDMVRPLKRSLPSFEEAERRVALAVAQRFGIYLELPASVKRADEILLATEARDLMGSHCFEKWTLSEKPLLPTIEPWSPQRSEAEFLERFYWLTRGRAR